MGMITIDIQGSFDKKGIRKFSAMGGGHAQAVAEAIEYLASEVLPKAISQDHQLQKQGYYPEFDFGMSKKRMETNHAK